MAYTFSGPASGIKGIASTNFTVTSGSGSVTDSISFADGASGVFTPNPLVLTSQSSGTVTYKPSAIGAFTLTPTSAASTPFSPTTLTYASHPVYDWKYLQSNSGEAGPGASTLSVPHASSTTSGNLLIAAVTVGTSGQDVSGVTDSLGNTYAEFGSSSSFGSIWYSVATHTGANTVTCTTTGGTEIQMAVLEYLLPSKSAASADNAETGGGSGTAISVSVPVTLPDLIVQIVTFGGNAFAMTPGAGWTSRQPQPGGGGFGGFYYQDNIGSLVNPTLAVCTQSPSQGFVSIASSFLATLPVYSITGAPNVHVGSAAQLYIVPSGTPSSDTITLSDGGAGGTFSPTSLTVTASPFAIPFTYTPATTGIISITPTSTGGHAIGGSSSYPLGSYEPVYAHGTCQRLP